MNGDGSDVQRLPLQGFAFSFDPAWSPDGARLALTTFAHTPSFDIYTVNANGTDAVRLTRTRGHDVGPAWSPDGSMLAFSTERTGDFELFVMNADGTGLRNLTNAPTANDCGCFAPFFANSQPAWSPNGRRIAFASDLAAPGQNLDVYVINPDGTGLRRLTTTPGIDANPDWSPDGRRLTFESERDGDSEIWVMNANGGGLQQLTSNSDLDIQPDWSPDGELIAFTSERGGQFDIWVMNADGTGEVNLTNDPAFDERPDWQTI